MPGIIISIHAPVKGATYYEVTHNGDKGISIHAPVKGATKTVLATSSCSTYFNPRTREGCDADALPDDGLAQLISIHAPVKGATPGITEGARFGSISIHAPVKGATYTKNLSWPGPTPFQSTHP